MHTLTSLGAIDDIHALCRLSAMGVHVHPGKLQLREIHSSDTIVCRSYLTLARLSRKVGMTPWSYDDVGGSSAQVGLICMSCLMSFCDH